MEEELGAPMYCAVVVSSRVTDTRIELYVRYHRKSIFDGKRKTFPVIIEHGNNDPAYKVERFLAARQLKPGDEIFVDPYGEEWCDPLYHNALVRRWNLRFA